MSSPDSANSDVLEFQSTPAEPQIRPRLPSATLPLALNVSERAVLEDAIAVMRDRVVAWDRRMGDIELSYRMLEHGRISREEFMAQVSRIDVIGARMVTSESYEIEHAALTNRINIMGSRMVFRDAYEVEHAAMTNRINLLGQLALRTQTNSLVGLSVAGVGLLFVVVLFILMLVR